MDETYKITDDGDQYFVKYAPFWRSATSFYNGAPLVNHSDCEETLADAEKAAKTAIRCDCFRCHTHEETRIEAGFLSEYAEKYGVTLTEIAERIEADPEFLKKIDSEGYKEETVGEYISWLCNCIGSEFEGELI